VDAWGALQEYSQKVSEVALSYERGNAGLWSVATMRTDSAAQLSIKMLTSGGMQAKKSQSLASVPCGESIELSCPS
jgi:hypothetical protein